MPWVRFDDQFPIHRKVAGLTDARYRLANEAVFWSARNLTDGRIAVDELQQIRTRAKRSDADDLVRRGIWHTADQSCESEHCPPPGPDGWVIHDYWEYQPSKDKVLREREAARKRQQLWRDQQRGKDGRW